MNLCLIEIEKLLQSNGRSLKEWPSLPYPNFSETFRFENQFVADELNYDKDEMEKTHEQFVSCLTSEQKEAYTKVHFSLSIKVILSLYVFYFSLY